MRSLAAALALGLLTTLTACGDTRTTAVEGAEHRYDRPLVVDAEDAVHPKAGAAGNVVECTTWGDGGFAGTGEYAEGATADSPAAALDTARSEGGVGGVQSGLQVAKKEEDRVLYVLEVDGAVKQAVIVHDGPATAGAGGPGWYVESWARCDYSELPRSFTDSIGLQIWTAAGGRPAPTTSIESWIGPEHCDWQSMTFLYLDDATYVRDPQPGLEEYVDGPYDEHLTLPEDAVDSGFERDGEHLWVSADRDTAFVGTEDDVEAWPREVKPLGCD